MKLLIFLYIFEPNDLYELNNKDIFLIPFLKTLCMKTIRSLMKNAKYSDKTLNTNFWKCTNISVEQMRQIFSNG